jgi:diguanylate cyclase (GGDEF)-like protein
LLPATDGESACAIAERVRQFVEDRDWPHRRITASLGVATMLPDMPLEPSALVKAADLALYRSKHRGRNRVTHARELGSAASHDAAFRS